MPGVVAGNGDGTRSRSGAPALLDMLPCVSKCPWTLTAVLAAPALLLLTVVALSEGLRPMSNDEVDIL
jgi:hypothetical protein